MNVPLTSIAAPNSIYAFARREIAGWGKQGRKQVGEVVVADALAPEAARRAQR